jgi:O-antigen ligase
MQFALSDKSRGGEYRAQGTFSHPLLYAEFLIFSLPITAFIFTQQQTNIRKYLLLFGIGIVVLALLLAKSRAGLGALVIVSICGLTLLSIKQILLNKRSFIRFFLPAGIFLITIALLVAVGPMLWDAISGTRLEHKSTQARLYFLQRGLSLISLEPALGYGGAKEVITKMGVFTTVDNYYLAIALEAGIPALILFLLTYVYFISIGVRLFFTQENEKAHLALALTLSLIAFAVFKAILSVPYNHTFIILTFALMFMLRDICLSPEVLPTRITTI